MALLFTLTIVISIESRSPRAARRNRRLPSVSEAPDEDWLDNQDNTNRRPVEVISFKSQNVSCGEFGVKRSDFM